MDELSAFELRLATALEAYVGQRLAVDGVAIAKTAAGVPAARRMTLLGSGRVPWRLMGAAALLVIGLAAGAAWVGSQQRLPAIDAPARNGLIAYEIGGDIFVGNPVTGDTSAIVAGPEEDTLPIFSPDGTRIAFVRGDQWTNEATIVVARTDGSDEHVAMPAGYSQRGLLFAWTPDSASIVVNHDSLPFTTPYYDGELSLLNASGVGEPRLLTPPLPIGPGGGYLDMHAPLAPMFRPPNGDLILSAANDPTVADPACCPGTLEHLVVWDADLESNARLDPEGLEGDYSFAPWAVSWSPDGSRIAFVVGEHDGTGAYLGEGAFVMNADGTGVRPLPSGGTWSPDTSRIAFQRCSTNPERPGAVIVVVDVATGAERVLEATSVETKSEGSVPRRPIPIPAPSDTDYCGWGSSETWRVWDYEGWSWTPDGHAITFLERAGFRPRVVDVETGEISELPWEADSAPSWQGVAQ